jgi:hypothetical protein
MNWFRANIRLGSRLALFALTLQLALSFGHFHAIAAAPAPGAQAMSAIGPAQPAADHEPESAIDLCMICAVTAMANAALFATPPALPVLQSVSFQYLIASAGLRSPASTRAAFQPRAPPAF